MVAPAAEPAAGTLLFGASLVDREAATVEGRTVQGINGFLRVFGRGHGDESEAARAPRGAVGHEGRLGDGAVRREGVLQVIFSGIKR